MTEPITISAIVGGAIGNILGGVLGNRTDAIVCNLGRSLVESLAETGLPRNHDALRAIRKSELNALGTLAAAYRSGKAIITPTDLSESGEFLKKLDSFLVRAEGEIDTLTITPELKKALVNSVDATLTTSRSETAKSRLNQLTSKAEEAVWSEISDLDPPTAFGTLFKGREPNTPSWFQAFGAFLGEQLKRDKNFKAIFYADRLASILGVTVDLHQELDDFIAQSASRFDILTQSLQRVEKTNDSLKDAISALTAMLTERLTPPEKAVLEAKVTALQQKYEISTALIRSLLTALGEIDISDDRILATFETQTNAIIQQIAEARCTSNVPEIAAARAAIRVALEQGNLDAANKAYTDARKILKEQRRTTFLEESELASGQARLALSRLDFAAAMDDFEGAAALASPFDEIAAFVAQIDAADVGFRAGELLPGLNFLVRAVTLLRALKKTASDTTRNALVLGKLGNALSVLGVRLGGEEGARHLQEAVDAYEAALKVFTEKDMPTDWAMTQNNLGNTLDALGERLGGDEGARRLEQAIGAHKAALRVFTKKDMPTDWAMTQNNLGNALGALGKRLGGEVGARRLEQAIGAHKAALRVFTKKDMPTDWAMTQNNLGNAFDALGVRLGGEEGARRLEQAIGAHKAALGVFTEKDMPTDWARTQNNLGNALRALGERLSGEEAARRLEQAIGAHKAALRVFTEKGMPTYWAGTQNNLGNALDALGKHLDGEEDARRLEQAIGAHKAALRVFTEEDMPTYWASTQNNLGNALDALGERLGGDEGARRLEQAIGAHKAALRVFTEKDMPTDWAMTQNNLGNALGALGVRLDGDEGAIHLQEAVDAYEAALRVYTEEDMPTDWAGIQNNLANALRVLGKRLGGDEGARRLEQAIGAHKAALRVFTEKDMPTYWAGTQNNLGNALCTLGVRLGGEEEARHLQEAVDAYEAALRVYTEEDMPTDWARTQNNLALALKLLHGLRDNNKNA